MNAFSFAWRSLVRQPARSTLGILGVAAVGALLFDMLLLSNGLVLSMRDLFTGVGFDIRITASDSIMNTGRLIEDAEETAADIAALPSVDTVITLRVAEALFSRPEVRSRYVSFQAAGGGDVRPWTIIEGRQPETARELALNANILRRMDAAVGDTITVREGAGTLEITLSAKPERRIGLLALPVLAARFRYSGYDDPAGHLARLDISFQRGGG